MFGLLNIDKPSGLTSRDAVNHVQRLVRPTKVGHAGTLDPMATGVLVIGLGQATRLVEYVQDLPKLYHAAFTFGCESDTEDLWGQVTELANPPCPTREEIEAALPRFTGEIEQRPPAYSALKVAGQRAYKLARRGEQVSLAPRKITIHKLRIVAYKYPDLKLEIECGSGTYVRSLGRDLALALGTGAIMSGLVRGAIGDFRLDQACSLDELTATNIEQFVLPAALAVAKLPSIGVSWEQSFRLAKGQTIGNLEKVAGDEIAAIDPTGRLVAILAPRTGELAPTKFFPEQ